MTALGESTGVSGRSASIFATGAFDYSRLRTATEAARPGPVDARPYRSGEPGFLTVEPDGRDDISFGDRLRQALSSVFHRLQSGREADEAIERALEAIRQPLEDARGAGENVAVQFRVVGIEVAFAETGEDAAAAFASYRGFGIEIGVARGDSVRAEDVRVLGLDGRSRDLSGDHLRAGLVSGIYRRTEAAAETDTLPDSARKRLEAAQAGLNRVRAMQDALKSYRSGDLDPLKRLLVDGQEPAAGRLGAVFPGIGTLSVT